MKIGFIGPGKVGVNLGRYFTHKGIFLTGYYGRTPKTTQEAATITNSKFYNNIQEIIHDSDILFITTPDDIISIIDRELSQFDLSCKSVCHASGSLKSTVLSNAKQSGASIYSIHPMYAFSSKQMNLQELERVNFSIEGDSLAQSCSKANSILFLMQKIGNSFFIRKKEDSAKYHLANVFVSNLMLSLLEIGTNYLQAMGLSEKESIDAVFPLVEGNLQSIAQKGFVNSLTGPVLRGDAKTIEKHLAVIQNKDQLLYQALSLNLLKLVAKKDGTNLDQTEERSAFLQDSEKYAKIYQLLGGIEQ